MTIAWALARMLRAFRPDRIGCLSQQQAAAGAVMGDSELRDRSIKILLDRSQMLV
jgi:hypothetical protein